MFLQWVTEVTQRRYGVEKKTEKLSKENRLVEVKLTIRHSGKQ